MDTSKSGSWRRNALPVADQVRNALEQRVRANHGRVLAALTRRFGVQRFAQIENAVQDAYVRALERWTGTAMPDEPDRWLVRVANNALIDALRAERRTESLDADPSHAGVPIHCLQTLPFDANCEGIADPPALDSEDELRLIFLCCDPAIPRAAQIALILNIAFGLSARQIASAFVSDERTIAQRIVRAKQCLREARVPFDVPEGKAIPLRVGAILEVLYLVFSEGQNPSGDAPDDPLCEQALRLVRMLTARKAFATPEAFALRALLCFHASRIPTRFADDGSLLLIQEQDRTRWDGTLITEGFACLGGAAAGDRLSRFHLEAAIAGCHAAAPTYAATDWKRIVELYDTLIAVEPSMVIDVNRALAVAMLHGARAGIDELDGIPERDILGRYPYALAAYADLHASLGNLAEARYYLDRALEHQSYPAQRALLQRKRAALDR